MADLRRVAENLDGLQEEWVQTAIRPVTELIAERFQRLAIKEKQVCF